MKKICGIAAVALALLLGNVASGFAWGGGASRSGFRGGMSAGFPDGTHNGDFHHGGHAIVHSHGFVGAPVVFGDPFWWGPGFYYPPSVIVQTAPPTYIQQAPAYWYYCQNPQGYYPAVSQCPGGWLTVVPPAAPAP